MGIFVCSHAVPLATNGGDKSSHAARLSLRGCGGPPQVQASWGAPWGPAPVGFTEALLAARGGGYLAELPMLNLQLGVRGVGSPTPLSLPPAFACGSAEAHTPEA